MNIDNIEFNAIIARESEHMRSLIPKFYHFKPAKLAGNTLLPLATLREAYPDVYAKAMVKYESQGREHVPENYIPLLGCPWDRVIFFSPVHPQVLHMELSACGYDGLIGAKVYVIDPKHLDSERLVVYEFDEGGQYRFYDPEDHLRYTRIGDMTRSHYRDAVRAEQRPFLFYGVTHVMYHGEICVDGLPVVHVRA